MVPPGVGTALRAVPFIAVGSRRTRCDGRAQRDFRRSGATRRIPFRALFFQLIHQHHSPMFDFFIQRGQLHPVLFRQAREVEIRDSVGFLRVRI